MQTGAKVICVDDKVDSYTRSLYDHWIKKDQIYTVRDVFLGNKLNQPYGDFQEVAVTLMGVKNKVIQPPGFSEIKARELGFNAERFREVEPPKTKEEKLEENLIEEQELVEV